MSEFNCEIIDSESKKNSLTFEIKGSPEYGLDKSIINSIRRILLSRIPSVAFVTKRVNGDLIVNKNNTSLHNEFLLHRISLIPLYIDPNDYQKDYLFELKVESTDDPIISIYANNFNIYKKNNDIKDENKSFNLLNYDLENPLSDKEKEKIFRPFINPFTNEKEYCLITELKSTDVKQSLHLYGSPSVSYGYENSRWQCVSQISYNFKEDDKMFSNICKEKFDIECKKGNLEKKDWNHFKKQMKINESERYFHKDNSLNPYWYHFQIQSTHFNSPKEILIQSIDIIKNNIDLIKIEIEAIQSQKNDSFIQLKNNNDNIYKILFDGYDDTIGNLIQSYTSRYKLDDKSLFSIIGYKKTHPLRKEIIFTLAFNINHKNYDKNNIEKNLSNIISFFKEILSDILIIFDNINQQLESKL